jgi:phage-related protein
MSGEVTAWEDPTGVVTTLDVDWDASGRYMPEVYHEEYEIPGQDGSRNRSTRFKPHEFSLKLTVAASSEASLRSAIRSLESAMNPKRGTGIIRVTSPIGDTRELPCKVVDGLGLEEKPEMSGPDMQQAVVTFKAFDPLWRDVSDTSTSFDVGAAVSFFPFFPLRLTNSQIAVDTSINNDGDDEAFPVWTIAGPGSVIKLSNLTTGEVLEFSTLTLAAGESVVIDTRPGSKGATRNTGVSVYSDLTLASSLWTLQTGVNLIRLEMSGAQTGISKLTVSFRKRYLSP